MIRHLLIPTFSVIVYFSLLDFVAPVLDARGIRSIWWVLLSAFLVASWYLSYGIGAEDINESDQAEENTKKERGIIKYALLGATLLLYDPFIQPTLIIYGISWVWIVPLSFLFAWVYYKNRRSSHT